MLTQLRVPCGALEDGRFHQSRCIFIVHNFGYQATLPSFLASSFVQGIYPCNKLVPNPQAACEWVTCCEPCQGTLPIIIKNVDIDDFGHDLSRREEETQATLSLTHIGVTNGIGSNGGWACWMSGVLNAPGRVGSSLALFVSAWVLRGAAL